MLTTAEAWLTGLMECGSADISMLDDCQYCIEDVLERCINEFGTYHINCIMKTILEMGMDGLYDQINERIAELEGSTGKKKQKELRKLKELNPHEDLDGYFNCLDTHFYLNKNQDIYQKYLQYAIDGFETDTGFPLQIA